MVFLDKGLLRDYRVDIEVHVFIDKGLLRRNPYLLHVHDKDEYQLHFVLSVPYFRVFFFYKLSLMGEVGISIFKLVFVAPFDGLRNTDLNLFTRLSRLISAYMFTVWSSLRLRLERQRVFPIWI